MGAPNIKIHELPQGYTADSDNDLQRRTGDEMVPVVNKLAQLTDVASSTPLVGAIICKQASLYCFAWNGGTRTVENVIAHPTQQGIFIPQTTAWSSVLYQVIGALSVILKDSGGNPLPSGSYTLTSDGITYTGSTTAATVSFFKTAAIGVSNTFAFAGDTFYAGANPTFNRLLTSQNGAEYVVTIPPANGVGYITVTGVTTSLMATYAVTTTSAKQFLSDHPNWVGGHISMWPDIFVGTVDYPGDWYTDTGGTRQQFGQRPLFRDPGTYSVNFRDGFVEFPEIIASDANPVLANFAYLAGVANVTNQKLDAVTGTGNTQFVASSESLFAGSHGKRWCNRDDNYTPINVYVNGTLTPTATMVSPYDTLDIKMS